MQPGASSPRGLCHERAAALQRTWDNLDSVAAALRELEQHVRGLITRCCGTVASCLKVAHVPWPGGRANSQLPQPPQATADLEARVETAILRPLTIWLLAHESCREKLTLLEEYSRQHDRALRKLQKVAPAADQCGDMSTHFHTAEQDVARHMQWLVDSAVSLQRHGLRLAEVWEFAMGRLLSVAESCDMPPFPLDLVGLGPEMSETGATDDQRTKAGGPQVVPSSSTSSPPRFNNGLLAAAVGASLRHTRHSYATPQHLPRVGAPISPTRSPVATFDSRRLPERRVPVEPMPTVGAGDLPPVLNVPLTTREAARNLVLGEPAPQLEPDAATVFAGASDPRWEIAMSSGPSMPQPPARTAFTPLLLPQGPATAERAAITGEIGSGADTCPRALHPPLSPAVRIPSTSRGSSATAPSAQAPELPTGSELIGRAAAQSHRGLMVGSPRWNVPPSPVAQMVSRGQLPSHQAVANHTGGAVTLMTVSGSTPAHNTIGFHLPPTPTTADTAAAPSVTAATAALLGSGAVGGVGRAGSGGRDSGLVLPGTSNTAPTAQLDLDLDTHPTLALSLEKEASGNVLTGEPAAPLGAAPAFVLAADAVTPATVVAPPTAHPLPALKLTLSPSSNSSAGQVAGRDDAGQGAGVPEPNTTASAQDAAGRTAEATSGVGGLFKHMLHSVSAASIPVSPRSEQGMLDDSTLYAQPTSHAASEQSAQSRTPSQPPSPGPRDSRSQAVAFEPAEAQELSLTTKGLLHETVGVDYAAEGQQQVASVHVTFTPPEPPLVWTPLSLNSAALGHNAPPAASPLAASVACCHVGFHTVHTRSDRTSSPLASKGPSTASLAASDMHHSAAGSDEISPPLTPRRAAVKAGMLSQILNKE